MIYFFAFTFNFCNILKVKKENVNKKASYARFVDSQHPTARFDPQNGEIQGFYGVYYRNPVVPSCARRKILIGDPLPNVVLKSIIRGRIQ